MYVVDIVLDPKIKYYNKMVMIGRTSGEATQRYVLEKLFQEFQRRILQGERPDVDQYASAAYYLGVSR